MPRYNRTFELSVHDVDLIEEAMRARGRELSKMRLALSEENPADFERVRVIEEDQRENGRIAGAASQPKGVLPPEIVCLRKRLILFGVEGALGLSASAFSQLILSRAQWFRVKIVADGAPTASTPV